MSSRSKAIIETREDYELFAEGYADAKEDRLAHRARRTMSGQMGAGYIFGWVGEIELLSAFKKWRAFGRPGLHVTQPLHELVEA